MDVCDFLSSIVYVATGFYIVASGGVVYLGRRGF